MTQDIGNLDRDWHGTVTKSNIEAIGKRLQQLLDGKTFTVIWVNEFFKYEPEVRVHQRLEGSRNAKFGSGDNITITNDFNQPFGFIHFCDTYGVWSFDTTLVTPGPHDNFKAASFVAFKDEQVTITHRLPAGNLCYTTLVVEGPIPASVYEEWGVEPPVVAA